MNPDPLISQLRAHPPKAFANLLRFIDTHYHYTPTAFANGLGKHRFVNPAGENEGSCKVFAFALLHGLDKHETLALFCEHYHHVLAHPESRDHQNIRTFMEHGWSGIEFFGEPLMPRR